MDRSVPGSSGRDSTAECAHDTGFCGEADKRALEEISTIVKPATILGWHRRLVAKKFDGSKNRGPGRPPITVEIKQLIVRMAEQNRGWGYDRIVGALSNLGHDVSDQTVGNILKRHGILPAPERSKNTTWRQFVRHHMDLLLSTDFFTAEVWTYPATLSS